MLSCAKPRVTRPLPWGVDGDARAAKASRASGEGTGSSSSFSGEKEDMRRGGE